MTYGAGSTAGRLRSAAREGSLGSARRGSRSAEVVGANTITVGEPVTISWTPPTSAVGDVLVALVQSQAGVGKVQCVVAVSEGSVTIDAGLLTHLVPSDADDPMVQMAVSPFAEVFAEIEGKAGLAVFGAPVVAG